MRSEAREQLNNLLEQLGWTESSSDFERSNIDHAPEDRDLPELPEPPLERQGLEETVKDDPSPPPPPTSNNQEHVKNNQENVKNFSKWLKKFLKSLKFVGTNTYQNIETSVLFAPVITNDRLFFYIDGVIGDENCEISTVSTNQDIDLFSTLIPSGALYSREISVRTDANTLLTVDSIVELPSSTPDVSQESTKTAVPLPIIEANPVEIDLAESAQLKITVDEQEFSVDNAIEEISLDSELFNKLDSDDRNDSFDVPEYQAIITNDSLQEVDEIASEQPEQSMEQEVVEEAPIQQENPLVELEEPPIQQENPLVEPEEPPIQQENPLVELEEPPIQQKEPPTQQENPVVEPEEPPIQQEELLVKDASGGNQTIVVKAGEEVIVDNFTGVGRGTNPSQAILNELDTVQFMGEGLEAHSLLFLQEGEDLVLSFEGDTSGTKVVLKGVQLEEIDNIPLENSTFVGNILFDGDVSIADSIDVFNAEWNNETIFTRDSVTILNDLDNNIEGFDASADVINAGEGDDNIQGLSGNDILRGEAGNDTLLGGAGDDTLVGGLGDDFLDGGTGNNSYTGGAGSDNFILSPQSTILITDFTIGEDQLILTDNLLINNIQITLGTSTEDGSSATLISDSSGNILAILSDIHPDSINQSNFGLLGDSPN